MSDISSQTHREEIDPSFSVNVHGQPYLNAINGGDFESVSAEQVYQTRFGDDLWNPNTLYVIQGTDSGLLPQYIINHGIPEGSRYTFVELDNIIPLLDLNLAEDNADRIMITPFSQWLTDIKEMGLGKYTYSGNVTLLRSCGAQPGHYAGYLPLTLDVETGLRQIIWRLSSQFDLRVHAKTQLSNLAENRVPAAVLRNLFEGKTAILVGAGPSLDDLIPWIKKHRDQVTLACVSRAAGRLKQDSLTPDIIVTADPQKLSYTVSKEMLDFGEETLLVNSNSSSPHLIGQWKGPTAFLNTEYPWEDPEEDHNIGVAAPTVTNTALNLLLEMGFREIILAGVDLCYSQEGHSHAAGSIEREHGPLTVYVDHTITTNSGGKAETNRGYYEAISSFAEQAEYAKRHERRIINPAPGAAKIDYIEYVPADSLTVSEPLQSSAWQTIAEVLPKDNSESRKEAYENKLAKLDKVSYQMDKLGSLAKKALSYNEKLLNDDGQSISPKYKKRIDKIEHQLSNDYPDLDRLIKVFNGREFSKLFDGKSEHDTTLEDSINKSRFYYQAYIQSIEDINKRIHIARVILENRLHEEESEPPFEKIFDMWCKIEMPGRASVWIAQHPQAYANLDNKIRAQLDSLQTQYSEAAENDDRLYKEFGQSEEAIHMLMGSIMDKAIEHFQHSDLDSLKRLQSGLVQRKEDIAEQLDLLVQGFIHELENDLDGACQAYEKLNGETLWTSKQFGLERSAELYMQREDFPSAAKTLETLSEQIDSYVPYYAQLLEVAGEISKAGDVYSEYIQKHHDDLDTAGLYGQFLVRHMAIEGAEAIFNHMQQVDKSHIQTIALAESLKEAEKLAISQN